MLGNKEWSEQSPYDDDYISEEAALSPLDDDYCRYDDYNYDED